MNIVHMIIHPTADGFCDTTVYWAEENKKLSEALAAIVRGFADSGMELTLAEDDQVKFLVKESFEKVSTEVVKRNVLTQTGKDMVKSIDFRVIEKLDGGKRKLVNGRIELSVSLDDLADYFTRQAAEGRGI